MRKNIAVGVLTAVVGAGAMVSVMATPGSGVLSAPVLARGAFADEVDIKFKTSGNEAAVLHVPRARDTVVQSIDIAPGGHTGWHSHPGPVVVVVAVGQLTFYSSDDPTCSPKVYSAGQAFVDSGQGHVHIARNELQDQNTRLLATYFDVPPGAGFRIDAPRPGNCAF